MFIILHLSLDEKEVSNYGSLLITYYSLLVTGN
jgi:hypothetical protein